MIADSFSRRPFRHAWRAAGLALVAFLSCYVTVFVAGGQKLGLPLLTDAMANVLSGLCASLLVWRLCVLLPWRHAGQPHFLPAHVLGVAVFGVIWYWTTALALGLSAAVWSGEFQLQFLIGPALHWHAFTAFVLYCAVAAGCYAFQAAADARLAGELQHRAEMAALRAQLNPHVLFNTLHSLLQLVRRGDPRTEEAIERFARFIRYVGEANREDEIVPLETEWTLTEDYVALEQLRMGPRLSCEFRLADDVFGCRLPALTLQPLVENAIRHGITPRPGRGHVVVQAWRQSDRLHVRVDDDGLGALTGPGVGTGTGLNLVRRRLLTRYGAALSFAAGPRAAGGGWEVSISFPAT